MKIPHLLNLGNVRKVKANLAGILDNASLDLIEQEIQANVRGLLVLARHHFNFSERQNTANWRQKISRLYYAAYNASRATRLFVNGEYSTDVKDHQKYDTLPVDFPSQVRYANQLAVLREDRNICDYDHVSRASDLALGTRASQQLVSEFLKDVHTYLKRKGMTL